MIHSPLGDHAWNVTGSPNVTCVGQPPAASTTHNCGDPEICVRNASLRPSGEGAEQRTATASHGDAGVRQVLYQPARPTRDGRTVLASSLLEFLAALSRLIPPPRVHRHRYHGVLAPNARLREQVINQSRPQHDLAFDADPGFDLDRTPAYDPYHPLKDGPHRK
jgi:hypothetical protein